MKTCTKCGIAKDESKFSKSAKSKDGLKPSCKECASVYEAVRKAKFIAAGSKPKELGEGTKKCTKCGTTKSYKEFYRRGDASGTYKSQCKKCIRPVLNKYKQDNPGKISAHDNKRRAGKMQRTPGWLTADDHWLMEQAYIHSKEQFEKHGIVFHVDHIVPLNGKLVSGLHCPDNLQVITWYENLQKGNKHE